MNKTRFNNELIADFMNRADKKDKSLFLSNVEKVAWVKSSQLKYNTSWEWLMPVVERVESKGFRLTIVKNNYEIEQFNEATEDYTVVLHFNGFTNKTKLEMTHQAVVEAIKFINAKEYDNRKHV